MFPMNADFICSSPGMSGSVCSWKPREHAVVSDISLILLIGANRKGHRTFNVHSTIYMPSVNF
jgi:hypothetical protein